MDESQLLQEKCCWLIAVCISFSTLAFIARERKGIEDNRKGSSTSRIDNAAVFLSLACSYRFCNSVVRDLMILWDSAGEDLIIFSHKVLSYRISDIPCSLWARSDPASCIFFRIVGNNSETLSWNSDDREQAVFFFFCSFFWFRGRCLSNLGSSPVWLII